MNIETNIRPSDISPEQKPELVAAPFSLPAEGLDAMVVLTVLHMANHLNPFINRDLRDLDLTSAQLNVLLLLQKEPLPLSEIGRRLLVSKPNITGLIDRLERKGLIRRENTSDRRVTIAQLTEQGHLKLTSIMPQHQIILADLTQGLNEEKKQTLIQLLNEMHQGLREKFHPHNP